MGSEMCIRDRTSPLSGIVRERFKEVSTGISSVAINPNPSALISLVTASVSCWIPTLAYFKGIEIRKRTDFLFSKNPSFGIGYC